MLKLKLLGEQVVSSITSEQRASASTARAAWVIVKSATHGLMETAHLVRAEKSETWQIVDMLPTTKTKYATVPSWTKLMEIIPRHTKCPHSMGDQNSEEFTITVL